MDTLAVVETAAETAVESSVATSVATTVTYFESLTRESAEQISQYYSDDAYFKDPFKEVRGIAQVKQIFLHMFDALDEPRFIVTARVVDSGGAFLVWDFRFRMKRFDTRTVQTIRGTSHLKFAADGRVNYHRDYWDAAEELYEKLPAVGLLMRFLKRQANA
jgi:steroid Delta-isomerase